MKKLYLKKENKYLFFVLAFCFSLSTISWSSSFDEKEEPAVVVKQHSTEIDVYSPEKATIKRRISIEVLDDKNHLYASYLVYGYDDNRKITHIYLEVRDAKGKVVKKVKKKDFFDQAAYDGVSLFSDNRLLAYSLNNFQPPYSFTIEVEQELKQLMSVPSWKPVFLEKIALESANLQITCHGDMDIRYQNKHVDQPNIVEAENQKTYTWSCQDFSAIHDLSTYDSPLSELLPAVNWVPEQFVFGGESGGFTSWNEFASWLAKLNQDMQELPPVAIQEVKALVTDDMTDSEKIKTVYKYLQERSRYVSVQLGIGGWQPFSASTVHETQYGDCKALSNYTQALLKEVGITSHYSVIYAGRGRQDYVQPDFPSNSFNHAVLLVPTESDTILLECTSQNSPCGFRSSFTDGRYALALGNEEGKLVKTPSFSEEENIQYDAVYVEIAGEKSSLTSHSVMRGFLAEIYPLGNLPEANVKGYYADKFNFGQYNIDEISISLKEKDNWNYEVGFATELSSGNYAVQSGNRFFISPCVFQNFGDVPKVDSMQYSFNLKQSYQYITDVYFKIPDGYRIESMIEDRDLKSQFGFYTLKTKLIDDHTLKVSRHFKISRGKYEKEAFQLYKAFIKEIAKVEQEDVVLVKG